MMLIRRLATLALGILILAPQTITRAADILRNVPNDALGFVVLKNLNATDAKVEKLLKTLNAEYPSPLIFLEAVTGIREGLDPRGDLLIAVLPPGVDQKTEPRYCVWLPVTDYDRLLNLLEATPGNPISAVRVADEDLLIARHGDWAVLMDPDQRPRMEQMLSAAPNPPAALAAWKKWINDNDAALVLLRPGIQQVLAWSATPPKSNEPDVDEPADDLFGVVEEPAENDPFIGLEVEASPNPLYDPIRREVHQWIVRSPKVKELVERAQAIGAAARLDNAGNATTSLRLTSSNDRPWGLASNNDNSLPPALVEKGDFIVNGAGHFPPALIATIASAHCRRMLGDLKTNDRIELGDELAAKFEEAFVIAASDIAAWSIVHQPGDLKSGIYNDKFLIVRVSSAKRFIELIGDAMQHWNTMHRESESDTRYVFDIEETKLGKRLATQYLLDVGATGGMPAIPEMRPLMERFFGPGGKMRMWIVPVDEQLVLLAAATPEQVTAALQALDRKQPIDWNKTELADANKLLADNIDWRVFFSPRGHYEWKRRQSEAMNHGVPVIGAKPAKDFPASPPVAFSGKHHDNELQVDAAVTAETIKSAGEFFKN